MDPTSYADSPFHAGEQLVQERLGVRDAMEKFGRRVIRDRIPEQHRAFYAQLPFAIAGFVDGEGRPWACVLAGRPTFISTPDARTMTIGARPLDGDPLATSLAPGLRLGVLGMDPASRRRNRLTGRVVWSDDDAFTLAVDQAFGNCPQYIQTRAIEWVREPNEAYNAPPVEMLDELDHEARAMIERSDTFFVASASSDEQSGPSGGADASHRGGLPGFVGIDDEAALIIPDYSGNNHYNTLGNFVVNPRAGLLFVDFERGDLLMLTGTVEIIWDGPEVNAFRGAERLWKFRLERGVRLRERLPIRWRFGEASPNNMLTGTWDEAQATLAAEAARQTWRPYQVARIVDESAEIRSLYLTPADGGARPTFSAGQHLPVRVVVGTGAGTVMRTYTLSSAPADESYRISVKREPEGLVSRYLHDEVGVGDIIDARAPQGHFVFDASVKRPAVLLSGGVGVTPMISMLRHAVHEGIRTRYTRSITLIHAARTTDARGFAAELTELVEAGRGAVRAVSVITQPQPGENTSFDFGGRINTALLSHLLSLDDYDFFLCGPGPFMQAMYDALRELGVRDTRILAEAFGPSSLTRRPDEGQMSQPEQTAAADDAVVEFASSKFEMRWTKRDGTLLELAEDHGLTPEFSCRAGACGRCAVRLCAGEVTYPTQPTAPIPEGHALLCSAVPAKTDVPSYVVLDL